MTGQKYDDCEVKTTGQTSGSLIAAEVDDMVVLGLGGQGFGFREGDEVGAGREKGGCRKLGASSCGEFATC